MMQTRHFFLNEDFLFGMMLKQEVKTPKTVRVMTIRFTCHDYTYRALGAN